MSWEDKLDILYALKLASDFVSVERNTSFEGLRTRAVRRLVEVNSEPDLVRRRCVAAALGLIAAGRHLNIGDIAWLVHGRDIGFPETAQLCPLS